MVNTQRMKNDLATDNRRESEDKILSDNRDRNDALTQERRSKADQTMSDNRARNDELTADRRMKKDANNPEWALAIFLLISIILAMETYLIFF